MDTNIEHGWRAQGILYPTMLIAAIAVIIFSMIGIAAMTGLLPGAWSAHRATAVDAAPSVKHEPQANPRALDAPKQGERQATASGACSQCGVVEAIRAVKRDGEGSMLGAATGTVVGGVLGQHVGAGAGRTAATIAGAAAGAFTGSEIERRATSRVTYQVRVQMSDGSHRSFYQATEPRVGPGQRVRVGEDGHLKPVRD